LIGVFDSGIGGLSVLQALRAELPQQDFTYIADSGHAPYGERDTAHVLTRARAITAYLHGRDIELLVVACNTATAAAIQLLRDDYPGLPMVGVEPAVKPAVALSRNKRIGVMATRSTLASAKFRLLLDSLAGQAQFVLQPCDGLAHAIERSAQSGDNTETLALCERYSQAMGRFGNDDQAMDTLVLGCTHYPFASEQLRQLLGPELQLITTGAAVARQTRRLLPALSADAAAPTTGQVRLLSTGQPQLLQAAAARWLNLACDAESLML
jgi:glutamate racemase